MFIKEVQVSNFRLFAATSPAFIVALNVPDAQNEGGGLTAFVGENGCGKTTLLDAIALPIVSFKAEGFVLEDFNDPAKDVNIKVLSDCIFSVDGTMPNSTFAAKGFLLKANVRSRGNKAYLSSVVVSDQLFLRANDKPKEGSPDLRVSVNNPFKGRRFDENDVLLLDKGRTYQTRLGTYNSTRFDRLMEDCDFQYIGKHKPDVPNIQQLLDETRDITSNAFLKRAIDQFETISGNELSLNLINNWKPFNKAFLAVTKENKQQLPLHMLGSGYEMVFSLLLAFHLSQQSGKQLICLIDEPELHLHPALQEQFVKILLEFSKDAQIILSTHSPLLIKQLSMNKKVGIQILRREGGVPRSVPIGEGVLPYASSNEINYLAFGLATAEYHDELYGRIQETQKKFSETDMISYLNSKGQKKVRKWSPERNGTPHGDMDVPLQVFIRNKIHHPENIGMRNAFYSSEELKESTKAMIEIIRTP
ncbi:AAA family ATPase [Tunturiibacter lichenicola]|uniref:AAA family ATPase n=1 Tax=Tunturiibacter lichenicola TaxID=2051959 RepID=UPI003D9B8F1E